MRGRAREARGQRSDLFHGGGEGGAHAVWGLLVPLLQFHLVWFVTLEDGRRRRRTRCETNNFTASLQNDLVKKKTSQQSRVINASLTREFVRLDLMSGRTV